MMVRHLLLRTSATLLLLAPLTVNSTAEAKKPSIKPTICLTAKPPPCKPLYS